ncbi:hypothetical protein SEA_KEELAN_115 [Gordonia phage Keelan]|nr:hypothetical protein SEA_KEELAN_115 [Gordonia phage Keelan]
MAEFRGWDNHKEVPNEVPFRDEDGFIYIWKNVGGQRVLHAVERIPVKWEYKANALKQSEYGANDYEEVESGEEWYISEPVFQVRDDA